MKWLALALALILSGCIAGPSPHPGTKNDQAPPGADVLDNTFDAGAGLAANCEAAGGFWNGSDCDGLNVSDAASPAMDAGPGADGSDEDAAGDVGPVDAEPADGGVSSDAAVGDGLADPAETSGGDGGSKRGPADAG